ncbi:MAG: peptidoglycan DD-metalloendopeptidase family protein [Microthrixaceae bacterium]
MAATALLALALLSTATATTTAAAQTAEGQDVTTSSSPSTTAPDGATTTTTTAAPRSTTTTTPAGQATTTTTTTVPAPLPSIPPELALDPRAPILFDPGPGDGVEAPVAQPSFDEATNEVLQDKVNELTAQLIDKQKLIGSLRTRLDQLDLELEELSAEVDDLDAESRANLEVAREAERALRDHTVDAFVNGSAGDRMSMVRTGDPVQLGVARELLDSVVESDSALLERHEEAQARLDRRQKRLLAELEDLSAERDETFDAFVQLLGEILEEGRALKAYENGAQVYVKGFVFPVRGEVEFIDSWGYPRMMGTASAHWHQGTDIFAPMGTPLVATESGVLDRVGTAGLGGLRLWLEGDSGNHYYYAHLSGFAEGMRDGVRVNAGDVVGYVGDTGNARGTPPHLHFEVHPGGAARCQPVSDPDRDLRGARWSRSWPHCPHLLLHSLGLRRHSPGLRRHSLGLRRYSLGCGSQPAGGGG